MSVDSSMESVDAAADPAEPSLKAYRRTAKNAGHVRSPWRCALLHPDSTFEALGRGPPPPPGFHMRSASLLVVNYSWRRCAFCIKPPSAAISAAQKLQVNRQPRYQKVS